MPPIQIAAPLAAAFNNQSPNLKTALRLTEAFFSYTPESLRATFDKDVADDFTWIPLPQSLKALGWNPLSKEESIKAIPFFFERIKDLEITITDLVENENTVVFYFSVGSSESVVKLRFDANGKVVEEKDFIDTKWAHETWSSAQEAATA
ncbi:uncharacterized protein EI90DRAFT_3150809 [Cantharellus anzutake]|uniref:uncharacterized protein n=1 Tax=Cantharellus anzutake TaxID=1750568 RepID=UPI0019047C80|nr:uncharacterized protein EI90DRAFT_3150809 [Cantharellus anzutake]KAF8340430.1 hypothetical protein EI90DRAFT_3150809 [Cantharellus anzutake]